MRLQCTTKCCTRCGETKPLTEFHRRSDRPIGVISRCKSCCREQNQRNWRENPELRERTRDALNRRYRENEQYREDLKHRMRERTKRITEAGERRTPENRAKWRAYGSRLRKNPERNAARKAWKRNRYLSDPAYHAQLKERHRALYRRNPLPFIRRARERHRQTKLRGSFTLQEWRALCAYYDHRCLCCGERKPLTIDHVIPISKGGANTIDNIQPLCDYCNKSKQDKSIDYRTLQQVRRPGLD